MIQVLRREHRYGGASVGHRNYTRSQLIVGCTTRSKMGYLRCFYNRGVLGETSTKDLPTSLRIGALVVSCEDLHVSLTSGSCSLVSSLAGVACFDVGGYPKYPPTATTISVCSFEAFPP